MKIDVEDVSPVKKRLKVELEPAEVSRERRSVLQGWASKASIPGFRPGKAPEAVIHARFAKEMREDLRDRLVTRYYREAAASQGLRPLGDPVLESVEGDDDAGRPFRFEASFEVAPRIELTGHRGVEVRRPKAVVGEQEVESALQELREARVRLVAEEGRAATTGDVLVADVAGSPEGGEPFRRERMLVEVGGSEHLPAFGERLVGARPGEDLEFTVDYPAEHRHPGLAGRSVTYRLHVHELKKKVLPELDDEFAKDLGDFEDLAALRARVREDLEGRMRTAAERAVRQAVLDRVLLANPVMLPETLVHEELRRRLEEIARQMVHQGIDLETAEIDWEALQREQSEGARKAVHARLVLDAVAATESLEASDEEVERRLERDAAAMGTTAAALRDNVRKARNWEALRSQLVREKSLDLLTSVANILDEE